VTLNTKKLNRYQEHQSSKRQKKIIAHAWAAGTQDTADTWLDETTQTAQSMAESPAHQRCRCTIRDR
jgi:DNA-binding transcriptional regulator YbjK